MGFCETSISRNQYLKLTKNKFSALKRVIVSNLKFNTSAGTTIFNKNKLLKICELLRMDEYLLEQWHASIASLYNIFRILPACPLKSKINFILMLSLLPSYYIVFLGLGLAAVVVVLFTAFSANSQYEVNQRAKKIQQRARNTNK